MPSLVPAGRFRNISGHIFTWLVCGSFQWRHRLLFTDCIVWDVKDKVIGFKRSLWDSLGMMEYRVSKASTISIITAFTRHQLSIDIFFSLLSLKYDIKIQNAKCSYLKVPEIKSYILSWGHSVFQRKKFFLMVCGSEQYSKVPEVVFATSL